MEATQRKVNLHGQVRGHAGSVYALALKEGQSHIYSVSGDGFVAAWDMDALTPLPFSAKTEQPLFSLLPLPTYQQLLVGNQHGGLQVIDTKEKQELKNWKVHSKGLFDMCFHPTKNMLYSLGGDGSLAQWQWPEQRLVKQINIGFGKLRQARLSPDGGLLAVSCQDGFIRVFDAEHLEEVYSFHAHDNGAHALLFHPTKPYLYSGGKDAHLKLWNTANGFECIKSLPAHNYVIYALALSPDGQTLATGSRDAKIKLWDADLEHTPQRIARPAFETHTHSINALLWTDRFLISAGDDRRIIAWEVG